jgi:glycosyltransferase involved in cell wall biosynthesis
VNSATDSKIGHSILSDFGIGGSKIVDRRPALFLMANTLETGGGERQFATLATALKPERLQVRLGCLRRQGAFADGLDGMVEFPPGGSLFGLRSQRARFALGRYLRVHRAVIAHSFDFYSNLMMIPAARLAGVPVVVGSQRQLGDLMSRFRNSSQHTLFRWCDRVVCNSRAAAARLQQVGIDPQKLAVIPNALTRDAFAETAPLLPAIAGGVRVVMIARMNDQAKRHDLFLRMAARLVAKYPKVEFALAGDGPLRAGLEAMAAELNLGQRVVFLGDRRDIPAVLASADISVLTSSSESLSNSIMESMAAGVPVVAGRVGGNDELIRDGENGFLVQAGSDQEFAERIEMLVNQTEMRNSFGATAKRDAQKFTVENICAQYQRLYLSLMEEKGIGCGACGEEVG